MGVDIQVVSPMPMHRYWAEPELAAKLTAVTNEDLVEAVGADKVVLGTDYPFDMGVTDPVSRVTAAGLPAGDLGAILSGNAASLLGHNDRRRTHPSEVGAHGRTE